MNKFNGSPQEFKDFVLLCGIYGVWREPQIGHHQYETEHGAFINWWEKTKTVNFQGNAGAVAELKEALLVVEKEGFNNPSRRKRSARGRGNYFKFGKPRQFT